MKNKEGEKVSIHELLSNIARTFKAKDKTFHAASKQITDLNEYNRKFTEPFGEISHDGKNNMILSQNIFMSMDSRKTQQNMNVFVIGGSPACRSFNCIGPNIMQANCSYVINDMGGGLYKEYSGFLEYMGYRVRCLNLMDIKESCCYNPFNYIHRLAQDACDFNHERSAPFFCIFVINTLCFL